ncbi:MAG: hypothetical protein J6Q73_05245 [Bacteroidaceae bacterium]|nr:hypothetical protein [Bacteroidaceae bacterium]MBO7280491.1 hypothetical protein [Bacteroidaceae bacterium]
MKRLILSVTCALSLVSCGGPPARPNQSVGQPVPKSETKLTAPTIKVFVENSGSMDGYVKGSTDFENAVYSYLSDLQLADLGVKKDSISSKNSMELYYINSKVLPFAPDVKAFINALEPTVFRQRGGNRGTSDMSEIIDTIFAQTEDNDVSVFVSDCIFSPGNQYRVRDNADEYIVAQQIGIKSHIVEKLAKNPNFAIVVMRLTSQFNGIYYNKFDDRQPINNDRPFYMWLMGDRSYLNIILKKVELNQIKGKGVQNIFMISKPLKAIPYNISLPQPGNGKYEIARSEQYAINNAKTEGKGGNSRFQVGISVNFSNILLPDEYLMNPDNYVVSNKAYGVEVAKYSGPRPDLYTHTIKLKLLQPVLSKGVIKISLKNTLPQWINDCTDDSGLDINAPGAMDKTYGLKYLLGGVYDAYASNGLYGSITINIK